MCRLLCASTYSASHRQTTAHSIVPLPPDWQKRPSSFPLSINTFSDNYMSCFLCDFLRFWSHCVRNWACEKKMFQSLPSFNCLSETHKNVFAFLPFPYSAVCSIDLPWEETDEPNVSNITEVSLPTTPSGSGFNCSGALGSVVDHGRQTKSRAQNHRPKLSPVEWVEGNLGFFELWQILRKLQTDLVDLVNLQKKSKHLEF